MQLLTLDDFSPTGAWCGNQVLNYVDTRAARFTWTVPHAQKCIWYFVYPGAWEKPPQHRWQMGITIGWKVKLNYQTIFAGAI